MAKENNKVKNLTLNEIKKQVKKLDSQTEYEIYVGDGVYKVKIDDIFKKTKQSRVLDDLATFLSEGNNRMELMELITPYVSLLMIKHFTNIEVSDDIDEALELMNAMIDLELVSKILNLMPENEVISMYELLQLTVNRMKENIEESEAEADRLSEIVENDIVKEKLLNGEKSKSRLN